MIKGSRFERIAPAIRFWEKVNKHGPVPEYRPSLGPCWDWTGFISKGYGKFSPGHSNVVPAHRWLYEQLCGPVPPKWHIDHLCRRPSCVNPSHLEAVTHRENLLRGFTLPAQEAAQTHCKRGHLFDEANTRMYRGTRQCRACSKWRAEEMKARGEKQKPTVPRICERCSASFMANAYQVKRGRARFCGQPCFQAQEKQKWGTDGR